MPLVLKRALPSGGVNLLDEPASLKENEAQWAKNVWPSKPGIISPRPSMEMLHYWTGGGHDIDDVRNFTYFDPPLAGAFAAIVTYASSGNGPLLTLLHQYNALGVANLHGRLDQAVDPQALGRVYKRGCFVAVNGGVIFLDGYSSGWFISNGGMRWSFWDRLATPTPPITGGIARWGLMNSFVDGAYIVSSDDTREFSGDPPLYNGTLPAGWRPRIAVQSRERLVYFDLADTHQDAMVWSDTNNPGLVNVVATGDATHPYDAFTTNVLDVDGPYVRLGGDNSPITAALVMTMSNEQSIANEIVMAFKWDRCFEVQGEPAQTSDVDLAPRGSLQVAELSVRAGCVGSRACCVTPYGAFWVGPDDVWMMSFGNLPIRVGTKLAPRLRMQARADAWKTECVFANGRLIITLNSSDGNADSGCDEQWWLDLRRGPPQGWADAAWFGPQVHVPPGANPGVLHLFRDDVNDRHLAVVRVAEVSGDYLTSVVSLDGNSGEDLAQPTPWPAPWRPLLNAEIGAIIFPVMKAGGAVNSAFPKTAYPVTADAYNTTLVWWYAVAPRGGVSGTTYPNFLSADVSEGGMTWRRSNSHLREPHQRLDNTVLVDILSRQESLGDPATVKTFDGVEISHSLNAPMAVQLISVGETLQAAPERTTFGADPSGALVVDDSSHMDSALAVLGDRVGGTRFLPATSSDKRQVGVFHSFRFKTASHFVFTRARYFVFSLFGVDFAVPLVATVPAGIYETVEDVVQAINTAIETTLTAAGYPPADVRLAFLVRSGAYDPARGGTLLPFASCALWVRNGLGTLVNDFAVPMMHTNSPSTTLGTLTFPAGPYNVVDPTVDTVDAYEDTSYLLSLLGWMDVVDEHGLYAEATFTDGSGNPSVTVWANNPYSYKRCYPQFDIFDLNFRMKSFAKRPT